MKTALTSLTALLITGIATAQTVTNLTGVTQIEMYNKDGAFALKNGGLYHFGTNSFRASDDSRTVDGFHLGSGGGQTTFIPPEFQSGVLKFSVGAELAVGLKEGGRVVVYEDVDSHANGDLNSFLPYPLPTDLESGVTDVAAGLNWFYYIKNGAVHYLGEPNPTGLGPADQIPTEALQNMASVNIGGINYCGLTTSGGAVVWGNNFDPSHVPAHLQSGCTDIDVINYAATVKEGAVHLFGNPPSAVASIPPEAQSGVVQVAVASDYVLARKADGSVIGWGDNKDFAHQPPAAAQSAIDIDARSTTAMALRADGEIVIWGTRFHVSKVQPEIHSRVLAVAAGHHHSLALTSWGELLAWGKNSNGQTDVPTGIEWRTPIGTIRHSEIFSDSHSIFRIYPTLPVIAGGGSHSLGIDASGQVRSWGALDQSTVPDAATNCVAVDAGTDFSMALTADGQVLSWGSIAQQEVPDAATNCVMIAAGYTHALALTADHTVLGWGDGSGGKLNGISGLSNIESIGAGEAGSVFVNNAFGFTYVGEDIGYLYAYASPLISTDAGVYQAEIGGNMWGAVMPRVKRPFNDTLHDVFNEQLLSTPVVVRTHSLSTGRRVGHLIGDNNDNSNLPPEKVVSELMVDFDIGDAFILALAQSGEIIAWGDNHYGQLDVPAEIYRPSPLRLAEMGIASSGGGAPDAGELSMLGAGGLGIQWGSNTQYEVQTTTDMLGGQWEPLPTDANNRFYRIQETNE